MRLEQYSMLTSHLEANYNLTQKECEDIAGYVSHLIDTYKYLETKEKPKVAASFYILRESLDNGIAVWWKPNRMGYTLDIRKAGKYSYEEAKEICTQPFVDDEAYLTENIDSITGRINVNNIYMEPLEFEEE